MTILKFFRKFLRKSPTNPAVEYVHEARSEARPMDLPPVHPPADRAPDNEVDLSARSDLEDYARGLTVSKESIERWISSGLLMPEELKVAEKLIHYMRKN